MAKNLLQIINFKKGSMKVSSKMNYEPLFDYFSGVVWQKFLQIANSAKMKRVHSVPNFS